MCQIMVTINPILVPYMELLTILWRVVIISHPVNLKLMCFLWWSYKKLADVGRERQSLYVKGVLLCIAYTNHFAYHDDLRTDVFVNEEDLQESDKEQDLRGDVEHPRPVEHRPVQRKAQDDGDDEEEVDADI